MDRVPVAALCISFLLASCGGGSDDGAPIVRPTPAPESPVSGTPLDPGFQPDPGPSFVEPQPGQVDVRPIQWDKAKVRGKKKVVIRYWSGVEPCYVLDRVEVDYRDDEVAITLYEGHTEMEEETACIEIAVQKATVVELDEPLRGRRVVDGHQAS